ncbi:MAG: polysaccharide biosynthesis tyrosine autokinase [Candidatus Brachytrichaceae bacterium NZ_4S206]|jgi:non-specific protein-tyrosine kinase
MELSQFTSALRRWWWIIVASVLVAATTSYFVTRSLPKTYYSQTTLLVGSVTNPNPDQNDFMLGQTLAQVYASLALREPVLRGTLEALNLDWDWQALREQVSTRTDPRSPLIEISVVDTDPQRAKVLADEIARQLILQGPGGTDVARAMDREFAMQQLASLKARIEQGEAELRQLDEEIAKATSRREIEDARQRQIAINTQIATWQGNYAQIQANLLKDVPNSLTVIEPAAVPTVPIGPKLTQNVLLAAIAGLLLAVAAIVLLELIDDTIKTSDDARRALGLPLLGSITRIGGSGYADRLVTASPQYSRVAEAYRVLRTNLQFSKVGHSFRTLIVTSSKPKEGKSTTAANLAAVIAQSGKRVILVDADLRRPVQHQIFELDNQEGLTTAFLDEHVSVERLLKPVMAESLSVLPSGPIPYNPSELLDSERMMHILEELKHKADLVILDSPPVLSVADAAILTARVDGVLLVVDSGYTRRGTAKHAKETLQRVGATIVGVVLNRAPIERQSDYDYEYSPETGEKKRKKRTKKQAAPEPATAGATGGMLKPVKLTKPALRANNSANNGAGAATERAS